MAHHLKRSKHRRRSSHRGTRRRGGGAKCDKCDHGVKLCPRCNESVFRKTPIHRHSVGS